MATVTIVFPWTPGLVTPSARISKIDDDSITFLSATCVEKPNGKGIYVATFTSPTAGNYYINPRSAGVDEDGVGIVFGVTDIASTFYESDLVPPGNITISQNNIDDISAGVVAVIQGLPEFVVNVNSPVDTSGSIQIVQGDSYLDSLGNPISIGLTGSLPSLEAACLLRINFGVRTVEIEGVVIVVDSTNYTLSFDLEGDVLTGVDSIGMPPGLFNYEVEVTYLGTTNKWTPSIGLCTVVGQIG